MIYKIAPTVTALTGISPSIVYLATCVTKSSVASQVSISFQISIQIKQRKLPTRSFNPHTSILYL